MAAGERVFVAVLGVWFAAQLGVWARRDPEEMHLLGQALHAIGANFTFLNLPGSPWNPDRTWFFNPFGWQLVFFTGFAFGMKWLPAPPVNRRLVLIAAGYLLISLPFAWFKIHRGLYLPDPWLLHDWVFYARDWMQPLIWKSGVGAFRYLHFLAIGYLAWAAVGPAGVRLYEGWKAPKPASRGWLWGLGAVALVTAPYAYVDEIKALWPWLDGRIFELYGGFGLLLDENRIGIAQLIHLAAIIPLAWAAIGAAWREWLARDAFLAVVPIIRKVGTQSLAVFMVSIVLSRFNGWWMDSLEAYFAERAALDGWTYFTGRDVWVRALVNLSGFGVLIGVAYSVGWFKSQPWRREVKPELTAETSRPVARPTPAE